MLHNMRQHCLLLVAALLTAGVLGAHAQGTEQGQTDASCTAAPLPNGGEVLSSPNGVTNPDLLNTLVAEVDASRVFPDSKTVVDMPLTAPPAEVAAAFNKLQLPTDPEQRNQTLYDFVMKWQLPPGEDMINTTMNFTEGTGPAWFDELADPDMRQWAHDLYQIWGRLTRQVSPNVSANPELHTMLPVPNPFVIPGARFREVYYWDSFWVIEGLLASNLTTLAEDIVGNFIYLINTYGHIPNGIRTYYLNRSQPPLFSEMVRVVYEATGNTTLLTEAMPALMREHEYWTTSPKQVTAVGPDGQEFNVSRYFAAYQSPRPESYIEDIKTAQEAGLDTNKTDDPALRKIYQDLASGAESGWDYSSRWFANGMNLTTIRTTLILPADLNAFLYQMEENIADFASELGCTDVETRFRGLAANRSEALNTLFWNATDSQWHDLICTPATSDANAALAGSAAAAPGQTPPQLTCDVAQNPAVFASNWVPLWAGAAEPGSEQAIAAVEALNSSGLLGIGGVAMSLVETGQQWDYPNVWPPVQWMMIDGAELYGGAPGKELAQEMTSRFITTVYATYEETQRMFEKFNTETIGQPGGGGEYEVVDGFGWTNGAVLDLLQRFGG